MAAGMARRNFIFLLISLMFLLQVNAFSINQVMKINKKGAPKVLDDCGLPGRRKKYSQPGEKQWPSHDEVQKFSDSINGSSLSCLGLKKFVDYSESESYNTTCLNYNGLIPNDFDSECQTMFGPTSNPDIGCMPNPFVTGAYYNGTRKDGAKSCMTHFQFLNNRNYHNSWMAAFIVTAATPEDIRLAVTFARKHNMGISVLSTGNDMHDRNAGPGPNTIQIRTTCFNEWEPVLNNDEPVVYVSNGQKKIWGNDDGGYAIVGAGLSFGQHFWTNKKNADGLYTLAAAVNREIVGGVCPSVGIVGWTIGGGMGITSPKYGLGPDQLLHVDLVLANGTFTSANYTHNTDLFYAMKGGGGGFGIIYSLKIKLHMPSCRKDGGQHTMENCYTWWHVKWSGPYQQDKTVDYVKKIWLAYINWSVAHRLYWFSGASLKYHDVTNTYEMNIKGRNLERMDMGSLFDNFGKNEFQHDRKFITNKTSSVFWGSENNHLRGMDRHDLWYLVNSSIAANDSEGAFVDTLLNLWQPYCDKFPHLPCVKVQSCASYLPAIDSSTGRGVHNSGGPISNGVRSASFKFYSETWYRGLKMNPAFTVNQGTEWKEFVLAPAFQKFSNASYFNQADYNLPPGEWGKRFWGKENYCELRKIKRKYDPDLVFLCRQCVGDWDGYQPGQE